MKKVPAIFCTIFLAAHIAWPQNLLLSVTPAVDTISAGDSLSITAKAPDDSIHPEHSQLITWTLSPAGTRSSLTTPQGAGNVFHAVEAYKQYYIILTFVDPANPTRIFLDTIAVYVKPGPPDHLLIEASADSAVSLNADNRLGTLTFPGPVLKDSAYAVLRDLYGNFVSHATLAVWASRDAAVVTAAAARTSLGEGEITRQSASITFAYVIASQAAMKDSVQVLLSNVTYSQIQIVVRGSVDIDTLQMRTDQDTTLYALALRSDGSGLWDPVQVIWGSTAGIMFNNPAPVISTSWTFRPVNTTGGKIFIVLTAGGRQLADTITAFIIYDPGPPCIVLYPAPGPPFGANLPYAPTVTDTVGGTIPLVAKVFNGANVWLRDYEQPGAPISWKIMELTGATGSAVLDKDTGYAVNFTAVKGYQSMRVVATLYCSFPCASDTIIITILPKCCPLQLVIEPDSSGRTGYPNTPNRAGQITFAVPESSKSVYAVLRDEYGNFISFSDSTIWTSRDTTIVSVTGGNASIGEGILMRPTPGAVGQAYVIAQDNVNPAIKDSVLVVLANCCSYNTLRIVVRDSSRIRSLTMSVGSDTTLKVQGNSFSMQGWLPVNANWSATPGLKNATPAPTSSTSWIIAPTDTGSGWIKVSMIDAASDSLFVTVLATAGLSFRSQARCGSVLSIVVPNAGSYVYALPLDVVHSRLFFTLYSLSGQIVFKSAGVDAGKPLYVNSPVKPGIYIVNIRTAERQLAKSRFVIVK